MTLITVQRDTEWLIEECALRFAVDADVPQNVIPLLVFRDLQKSIDILEKVRHWRFLDRVPSRYQFANKKACCQQMAIDKPGTPLRFRWEVADCQGDTDDLHNDGEATTGEKRLYVDNKIDWVVICHFVKPALVFNLDNLRETSPREREGFVSPELLPKELLAVNKRYKDVASS